MTGSARDRVVVSGVIEMARSLDLGVVAEGVETEEQLAMLARAGCTTYQGYLCSRPLAADELAGFVKNWESARKAGCPTRLCLCHFAQIGRAACRERVCPS